MIIIMTGIQMVIVLLALILFAEARIKKESAVIAEELNPVQKIYIVDGEIKLGDFAALLPFWARQGIMELLNDGTKLTLVKKRELSEEVSKEQAILFQGLFLDKDICTLGLPQADMLTCLRSARMALINGFEDSGKRIFTKISMRNKGIISFMLFISILLQSFIVLKEIRDYSPIMEDVTFVIGVIGISSAVYFAISSTLKNLKKRDSSSAVMFYLSLLFLFMQYITAACVVGFVFVYLKGLLVVTISACVAYLVLTLGYLFICKRTNTNIPFEKYSYKEDMLFAETKDLIQDPVQCNEIYERLNTIRLIWNDADKVKLPGNNIPVSYN